MQNAKVIAYLGANLPKLPAIFRVLNESRHHAKKKPRYRGFIVIYCHGLRFVAGQDLHLRPSAAAPDGRLSPTRRAYRY
jgi:hypothetical protein